MKRSERVTVLAGCGILAAGTLLAGCTLRGSMYDNHDPYYRDRPVVVAPPPGPVYGPPPGPVYAPPPGPVYAPPPPVVYEPAPIIIQEAPPAVVREVRTPRPGPRHVWIDGYYVVDHGHWRWSPGHWELPPRPNAVWVAPRYESHGRDYHFSMGFWR